MSHCVGVQEYMPHVYVGYRGACHMCVRGVGCMYHMCGGYRSACHVCVWVLQYMSHVGGCRGAYHIFVESRGACYICGRYRGECHMCVGGIRVHSTCG